MGKIYSPEEVKFPGKKTSGSAEGSDQKSLPSTRQTGQPLPGLFSQYAEEISNSSAEKALEDILGPDTKPPEVIKSANENPVV